MADDSAQSSPLYFFGLPPQALDAAVASWGWPAYCGRQLRDWVYRKGVCDPGAMTNLSKAQRALLAREVVFESAAVKSHQTSADGTHKLLLTWPSGAEAETVMIPEGPRRTACVSSQVGCPVGCRFCASGVDGVKGNLTAAQIVEQVFGLNRILQAEGARITHVVFMGMGEPLANYANVLTALAVLHDPQCFNIGARRITISTVGVPPKMRQLAEQELPVNLAISLHAPNEPLRRQLIPWAEHFALEDILAAGRYYFEKTGREITLEYILLAGVNDQPQHARQLARLCKSLRANVNLIRYNEVAGLPFERPKSESSEAFQRILRDASVNAHLRKSRGRDIDAACGQLRRNQPAPQSQIANRKSQTSRPGFSFIEFLVFIGIIALVVGILVPYVIKQRENANRIRCADNLRALGNALKEYGYSDRGTWSFPRTVYDAQGRPDGYTAYTGADDPDPFAADTTVKANDVTASLWLLVRGGFAKPEMFICPSTSDRADPQIDGLRRRGNFRSPANLSYSYCSPFTSAPNFILADWLPWDFAVMADKNPGIDGVESDVTAPAFNSPPLEMARANSRNHSHAGQNVLYPAGNVSFERTPYCGVNSDNIYTAQSRTPATVPSTVNGYCDPGVGPSAAERDSFLVPTEQDR